jgi:hypothetical protein
MLRVELAGPVSASTRDLADFWDVLAFSQAANKDLSWNLDGRTMAARREVSELL